MGTEILGDGNEAVEGMDERQEAAHGELQGATVMTTVLPEREQYCPREALLSEHEERDLIARIQRDPRDFDAQDRLVRANIGLVYDAANKLRGHRNDHADLCQEGCLGLLRAAKKFNLARSFRFSTYATWWIRQGMTRYIENSGTTIHIPAYQHRIVNALRKHVALTQHLGETASTPETQAYIRVQALTSLTDTDIDPTDVLLIQQALHPISLDTALTDKGEMTFADVLIDPEDTESEACDRLLYQEIMSLLHGVLTERERTVIQLRYGLTKDTQDGEYTLAEVGKALGLSRERIRQIEAKALRRLREALATALTEERDETRDHPNHGQTPAIEASRKLEHTQAKKKTKGSK